MENYVLSKKQLKIAAYLIGISALLGFNILMFMPTTYKNPFSSYLILFQVAAFPIAFWGAVILWAAAYFLFKKFIKSQLAYKIILVVCIILSYAVGVVTLGCAIRRITRTPPYENKIDTNNDGKIDKWVYDNDDKNLSTIVEIDTDYDGRPDIREYYRNGHFVKREQMPDSAGK